MEKREKKEFNPKGTTYFQDTAKKLLTYAETEHEGGEKLFYLRTKNLNEVLQSLKISPNLVFGMLLEKGFLKIKKTNPVGYYLCIEGKNDQEIILLPVDRLQKLAKKIRKFAAKTITVPEGTFFSVDLNLLQRKLSIWNHDPDNVIPQLVEKGYLIARKQNNKIFAYWVFQTQKASKNARFNKAA